MDKNLKKVTIAFNTKTVLSFLNEDFIRIHKSYIVNINFIVKFRGNQIQTINGEWIDISISYRAELMERLNIVTNSAR